MSNQINSLIKDKKKLGRKFQLDEDALDDKIITIVKSSQAFKNLEADAKGLKIIVGVHTDGAYISISHDFGKKHTWQRIEVDCDDIDDRKINTMFKFEDNDIATRLRALAYDFKHDFWGA